MDPATLSSAALQHLPGAVGDKEVEVGVAAGLQRPVEERLHLSVDASAEAAHLGLCFEIPIWLSRASPLKVRR